MAGEHGVSPERYEVLKAQFGFDQPLWQQYLNYLGELLHGDFGDSFSTKKPVLAEFCILLPGDARTVALRHHPRHPPRRAGGHLRGGQARLVARPGDDGHGAGRLFDADLLVGAAADHLLLRQARLDAGVGAHRAARISSKPVTGFMLIDSLLLGQKGAFGRRCST